MNQIDAQVDRIVKEWRNELILTVNICRAARKSIRKPKTAFLNPINERLKLIEYIDEFLSLRKNS